MIASRPLLMAVVCALLMLSAGCNLQQAGKVLYSDGCVLYVDGVSSAQAKEIYKEWRINGCEVIITNEVGELE